MKSTHLLCFCLLVCITQVNSIQECGPDVNNGSHTWSQGPAAEWTQQGEFNNLNQGKPEWITNQVEVYCFGCMLDIDRAGVATVQNSNCRCIRKRKLFQAVNAWYK